MHNFSWRDLKLSKTTKENLLKNQPSRDAHTTTQSDTKQYNIFLVFYLLFYHPTN